APESLALARAMIARKVEDGGATVYELEIVARDGRRIPIEVSTRLGLEDGRRVAVHGIARDISERKRADASRAAEARIAAALAEVGRVLMSSLDTPVLFERLCQSSAEVLGRDAAVIASWDAPTARYAPAARFGTGTGGPAPPLA